MNLFLSGQPDNTAGGLTGPGILPVVIDVPLGAIFVTFDGTQLTDLTCCDTAIPPLTNDANGRSLSDFNIFGTNIQSFNGISGIIFNDRVMFLAGVFLDDNTPATGPGGPARLTDANFPEGPGFNLWPQLGQSFFVGDGLNAANDPFRYIVPTGATRLFLGFLDGAGFGCWDSCAGDGVAPGVYDDNAGSGPVDYAFTMVPEPSTWVLFSLGLAGVAVRRFRR
ncbi:MAG: PEP-CTERM sorting domain-containing protein [Bryobacterales bacterium]|nr:PEP-CTERM sorting domain-containing protein [Bryobacterales bacterium]